MLNGKITLKNFINDYCIDDVKIHLVTYDSSDTGFKNLHEGKHVILSSEIDAMYLKWNVSKFYFYADGFLFVAIVP